MATVPIRIISTTNSQLVCSLKAVDKNAGMTEALIEKGKRLALESLAELELDNRGYTMSNGTLRFWGAPRKGGV